MLQQSAAEVALIGLQSGAGPDLHAIFGVVLGLGCERSQQERHEQRSETAGEGHLKVPFHVWPVGDTIQRASPLVVRLSGPRAKPSGSE